MFATGFFIKTGDANDDNLRNRGCRARVRYRIIQVRARYLVLAGKSHANEYLGVVWLYTCQVVTYGMAL